MKRFMGREVLLETGEGGNLIINPCSTGKPVERV